MGFKKALALTIFIIIAILLILIYLESIGIKSLSYVMQL